jgi:hypothetical protein
MHPRIAELTEFIAARREEVLAAAALVPPELRQHRPEPDVWSVAEVLDHLARVERGVSKLVTNLVAEGRARGLGAELSTGSVLRSLDGLALGDRSRFIAAPERVMPRGDATADDALAALAASRSVLLAALAEGDGLALGELTWAHPLGTLDLYQWVLFVGKHEARHAEQMREIGRRLPAA